MSLAIDDGFPRPSADLLARFAGAPTGPLCDAMGRRGALAPAIRRMAEAAAFAGVALTVRVTPNDTLAAFAALTVARPGDVIVIATEGWAGSATIGDTFVGHARNRGVVAVVTDGLVRDLAGIARIGLPVFAAGVSPNAPFRQGPGAVGGAVELGGRRVEAGDIVVGDRDGVVVVPLARAEEIAAALPDALARDAAAERAVEEGAGEPAWLAEAMRAAGVRRG